MSAAIIPLRDDQWDKLAPLLPGKRGDRGCWGRDNRLFIEAVVWHTLDGSAWRDLPLRFGKWNTVYTRVRRWDESGVWRNLAVELYGDPELRALIEKIAAFCEQQRIKVEQRKMENERRESCGAPEVKAGKHTGRAAKAGDMALHWLRLVGAA
ncbi:MAG: transposase [Collimonas sp.]|uniref:transposase n=1 Tax=Collimonas sp. TaxID=1963772 RepID=UPI003265106B